MSNYEARPVGQKFAVLNTETSREVVSNLPDRWMAEKVAEALSATQLPEEIWLEAFELGTLKSPCYPMTENAKVSSRKA